MGVIKQQNGDVHVLLNSEHLLGRNAYAVNTFVPGTEVSRIHARLVWQNQRWYLHDHSMNGTLVNKQHINNAALPLRKGDLLKLGVGESTEWVLLNDDPPSSYFKAIQKPEEIRALFPRPGIPFLDHPDLSIYFSSQNCWQLERAGSVIDLDDGARLHFEEMDWNFYGNGVQLRTPPSKKTTLSTSFFVFNISEDEERIHLTLQNEKWELDLGERVHHYMLLALARGMMADLQANISEENRGWMEVADLTYDMSREFRKDVDEYQLNVQLHRFRRQLKEGEPYGYLFTNCIERRKGRIRFAYPYFKIIKESQTLFEVLPETVVPPLWDHLGTTSAK